MTRAAGRTRRGAPSGTVDYTRFLPEQVRENLRPGISTWWNWRGYDVHVVREVRPQAPARIILIHGAGAHSGALFPVAQAIRSRCDLAVPDLPLYGLTQSPDPAGVTYQDWIDLVCAFVEAEDDGRPMILLGASIGGMVAYEVAARTGRAAAVIATCLLDTEDPDARAHASRFASLGRLAPRLLPLLDRVKVPIALVADAKAMSNDRELTRACLSDRLGAGGRFRWDSSPPGSPTGTPRPNSSVPRSCCSSTPRRTSGPRSMSACVSWPGSPRRRPTSPSPTVATSRSSSPASPSCGKPSVTWWPGSSCPSRGNPGPGRTSGL